jgi:serine phosphatase RsbU (regulator of sigma subunit)/Tfp pilus assembly protein PilF
MKSMKLMRELNNQRGIAVSYAIVGNFYIARGNYPKSLENYLEAQKIFEELRDTSYLTSIYSNVGVIYYYQKNYSKALEYYNKSVLYAGRSNKTEAQANSLNNIGLIFNQQGKHKEALDHYFRALKLFEKMGNQSGIAGCYQYVGDGYTYLQDYETALAYHRKALKLYEELQDTLGAAAACLSLGGTLQKSGNNKAAIELELKSLKIYERENMPENLINNLTGLADAYKALGDYKTALKYREEYISMRDSLLSKEDMDKMASLKADFEIEKREKERELMDRAHEAEQKQAILRQKTITWSVTGGGCVMLLFALVALRGYQQKKKANEQISAQKHLIEEKNKSIVDSINYSKNIQQAILPSEKSFRKYFPDSFILYQPKDIVSGDFYFVGTPATNYGDKLVIFGVADCTGHGVPGAFLTLLGKTFIQLGLTEKSVNDCASALNYLNNGITEILDKRSEESMVRDGMDIALCAINHETMTLEFSGAKNGIIICRDKEISEMKGDKHAIGELSDHDELLPYSNKSFRLQKGDVIYVYSDGFVDQFGGKDGKKFKSKNLQKLLAEISLQPMNEQKNTLEKTFYDWKGNLEQVDDICVIGIRV